MSDPVILSAVRNWPGLVASHAVKVRERRPDLDDEGVLVTAEGYAAHEIPETIRQDVLGIVLRPATNVPITAHEEKNVKATETVSLAAVQEQDAPLAYMEDNIEALLRESHAATLREDAARVASGWRPWSDEEIWSSTRGATFTALEDSDRMTWAKILARPDIAERVEKLKLRLLPQLN